MAGLLKGLAIAAGAGLAIGIAATVRTGPARPRRSSHLSEDELLRIEPLLGRIESVEARLDAAETRATPSGLKDLDRRVAEQELHLRELRASVEETERRSAIFLDMADARLRQAVDEIPAAVAAQVTARAREIEARLLAEAAQHRDDALAILEQTIEQKMNSRIAAIEQAIADQSASIIALREHAEQTSVHMQKLLGAVERLCERTTPPPPPHAFATEPEPVFAGYSEPEKKRRFQIGRIFGVILTLGLWGFRR